MWKHVLHDGWVTGTAAARRGGWRRIPHLQRSTSNPWQPRSRQRQRSRNHLQARPDDLGRSLRQQRLAAGAAQAADEDHVGPDRVDQREAGAGTGSQGRRSRRVALSRQHRQAAGRDRARTSRSVRHRVLRLRPASNGPRRHGGRPGGARLRRLQAAHLGCTLLRRAASRSRRSASTCIARTQEHHLMEDRAPVRVADIEQFRKDPAVIERQGDEKPPKTLTIDPRVGLLAALQVGDADRSDVLHRLQHVHDRLPVREQHPGRRQGAGRQGARDAVDPRRPLLRGRPGRRELDPDVPPAGAMPAVRERAMRTRLSGRRDDAQRGRPERHGLQPLRRHALLLEQLPIQGATLQLPALPGLGDAETASRCATRT